MKRRRCGDNGQPGCGAEIYLVPLIPLDEAVPARLRKFIPLDPGPVPTDVAPSHARSPGWDRCRALRRGEEPAPGESPALTHFATCPLRKRATTPEGPSA